MKKLLIYITYDATGRKWLQKTEKKSRIYAGALEFVKTEETGSEYKLEAGNTGDGRLILDEKANGGTGQIYPEYHHKDHLGNTRVAFTDRNENGRVELLGPDAEVTQQLDYYPFGLQHEGEGLFHEPGTPVNRMQYNGKELVEGIGLIDYGARWYDPAIGRWSAVDPLASDYSAWSPYNYVLGNPIVLVDPDGMRVDVSNIKDVKTLIRLITDLSRTTGLDVGYRNGELVDNTSCDDTCNSIDVNEDSLRGSKNARSYLQNLISMEETISIHDRKDLKDDDGNLIRSAATGNGFINLDASQADEFQASLKENSLNEETMNLGMVFLHESLHTDAGASAWAGKKRKGYPDPVNGNSSREAIEGAIRAKDRGPVVDRINIIRGDLGLNLRGGYVTGSGVQMSVIIAGKETPILPAKTKPK